MRITHSAYRAARTAAVLLSLTAPVLLAGCAAMDQPQSDRMADSNGARVPASAQSPLAHGYPYGYW